MSKQSGWAGSLLLYVRGTQRRRQRRLQMTGGVRM